VSATSRGLPTGAAAEPGTTRTPAMRRPHSGVFDTITQTPSVETVLWTTGRFRVAMTPDNGQTADLDGVIGPASEREAKAAVSR
jgi:hypothetical protein